jgi:serine/threonine-protein kinase RsbW
MSADQLYRFPARMESLGPALALVKAASLGVEPAAALRAETVVEELLTNSVLHGGAARTGPASIWLAVTPIDEGLKLRYEDEFGAFDPMPVIAQALRRTENPMDQRPVGGLGLLMAYRLSDEFHYVREHGRNCLDLTFAGRRPGVR